MLAARLSLSSRLPGNEVLITARWDAFYRRDLCASDLRFVTISVVLRCRASSQQAVGYVDGGVTSLGDGDSTTNFRVGYPKLRSGDPERGLFIKEVPQQSEE